MRPWRLSIYSHDSFWAVVLSNFCGFIWCIRFHKFIFALKSPCSLDLSDITLAEGCGINPYTFFRCNVKDIYPFRNINSYCDLTAITLSQEVLLRFINNLAEATTTQTLTLGTTNLAKLSEDQIAIATNKGWTVV